MSQRTHHWEKKKMADMQKYVCYGGVGLFFGILIMSIALLATSFRRLESDEGKTA